MIKIPRLSKPWVQMLFTAYPPMRKLRRPNSHDKGRCRIPAQTCPAPENLQPPGELQDSGPGGWDRVVELLPGLGEPWGKYFISLTHVLQLAHQGIQMQ